MKISIPVKAGTALEFECEDSFASQWVARDILEGKTYPAFPFIDDVDVICDIGANCGAASVHFARHYPSATVHAFEPGSGQRAYLEHNALAYPNIQVHPIGLHVTDQETLLYPGMDDSGKSSLTHGSFTLDQGERVTIRSALGWAREHGIEQIDVLKVDVEGCEAEVLQSLEPLLPTVKALYVEYDSRQARRALDALLADTHELYVGRMLLDQGECTYLSKEAAERDGVTDWLRRSLFGDANQPI